MEIANEFPTTSMVLGFALLLGIIGMVESPSDQLRRTSQVVNGLFFIGGSVMAGLGAILWVMLKSRPGQTVAKEAAQ